MDAGWLWEGDRPTQGVTVAVAARGLAEGNVRVRHIWCNEIKRNEIMKRHPRTLYDRLLAASCTSARIQEVIIGLTWTLCRAEGVGLCMSPGVPTRTLSLSSTQGVTSSATGASSYCGPPAWGTAALPQSPVSPWPSASGGLPLGPHAEFLDRER